MIASIELGHNHSIIEPSFIPEDVSEAEVEANTPATNSETDNSRTETPDPGIEPSEVYSSNRSSTAEGAVKL